MQLLRNFGDIHAIQRGAVAIGNFDGVHRGHALIVERLLTAARTVNGPAVVFTFDPHPVRLLRPDRAPPPLTWTDRKAELLAALGVDAMLAYPTDEALLALSPRAFFDQIVVQQMQAQALVEGPNFYFGRDRGGNVALLGEWSREAGINLDVVPPVEVNGEVVSSSRIRKLLASGDVAQASALLTSPYRMRGMVVHGAGRGARLGFPTANLDAVDTLIPALGVYAGRARVAGQTRGAAIHIGPNPTFGESVPKIEVHLLDWSEPLYGQPLEVDFLARLRDIQRFDRVEDLLAQLQRDVTAAEQISQKE